MRGLHVPRLELDEAWSYVGKKQKRVKPEDGREKGDQYVFIALAGSAKAIVSYRVGKRDRENTQAFLWDVRERVFGAPEIISDGWSSYPGAVEEAFGTRCTFGVIEKHYSAPQAVEAARRYSPGEVVSITKRSVVGIRRCTSLPATLSART